MIAKKDVSAISYSAYTPYLNADTQEFESYPGGTLDFPINRGCGHMKYYKISNDIDR